MRRSEPTPIRRPQVVLKQVSDAEFEPTPIMQLKAGQRIEHNRFGFGNILEITGSMADLKAKEKEIEQLRAELSQLKTGDLMNNSALSSDSS